MRLQKIGDKMELLIFLTGFVLGGFFDTCICRIPQQQLSLCKPLAIRYPLVELLSGLLFLSCFWKLGVSFELFRALIFASFLLVIAFIDYEHQLIFDKMLIYMTGAGAAVNWYMGSNVWGDLLAASIAGGGILLAIVIISNGGMGYGDVKFAAALGLWLGLQQTILTLFLAFAAGGISGIICLTFHLKSRKDAIPFGPYLAAGALLAMLYGKELLAWYRECFL